MRPLAGLFAVALGIGAQTPAPELQRIRARMMEALASQPNYTCLETIERSQRDSGGHKFELLDTLRMEVALVNGKEMFAWPGSKQFDDQDIREFIPSGMFGTGDFALHARSVFGTNIPSFESRGESPLGNRIAWRFDFQVKRAQSGFHVRIADLALAVGYHGSFYADPQSLDVRRLEIEGDDIPAALKVSQISDSMDYAPVPIGQGTFLLPAASEEIVIDSTGHASRNRLQLTACRQFTGQSVLSFADVDSAEPVASQPEQELQLPSDLLLILRLAQQINTEDAAIGDQVRAELTQDLKSKGQVLVSKGAIASGRISRMERHREYTMLGLTFSEIESGRVHARLDLDFDRTVGISSPAIRNAPLNSPPRAHEALMMLQPGRVRLSQGILMFWRTRS